MLYTSGSTGQPKGVMAEHRNLRALVGWLANMLELSHTDRCAEHASFCFDASLFDLMTPLTVGAEVHILSETLRHDLEGMNRYIHEKSITGMTLSTQLGMELINTFDDLPLRYIVAGGEALQPTRRTSVRIINGYGPTEFTVCASYHVVDQERQYETIPIGQPVPGSHLFIVDPKGRLVPKGMAGELCLSGRQMARGYWKQEKLTREKFSDCPFVEGERMYRTGDLCRWNEEGQLEYLGRIDSQVKLRGYRIELGEIESQSLKYDGISQAVASVYDGQLLCLYYTADFNIDEGALKEFLTQSLPEYMVPATYIHLEELPLTPNGKVDRKKLPAPEATSAKEYIAPEGEVEVKIAAVFAEVLNLTSPVGALDDFFSLGGDSIKSIRLVSRLRNDGILTQVSDVMYFKTVRGIANASKRDNLHIQQEEIVEVKEEWTDEQLLAVKSRFEAKGEEIERIYPLTITQVLSLRDIILNPELPIHMMSDSFTAKIAPTKEQLEYVIDQLSTMHEVLRTAIIYKEVETPQQAIISGRRIPLEYMDLSDMSIEAQDIRLKELAIRENNRCMDLENEPLFRMICAKTSESTCKIYFTMQHLISDGWSFTILIHDFMQLLEEAMSGQRKKHEVIKGVFEKYVRYNNQTFEFDKESYWSRFAEGYSTEYVFPLQDKDIIENNLHVRYEHVAPICIDREETARLKQLCAQESVTLNTALELAWGLLLQDYNHTDDILFGKITSGRDMVIPSIEHTIGMFIRYVPVRLLTAPTDTPRILLRKLMNQAAESKQHETEMTSALTEIPLLYAELSKQYLPYIISENFIYNNVSIDGDKLVFDTNDIRGRIAKEFSLYVEIGDTLELYLDYDVTFYPTDDISQFMNKLMRIIRDIINHPDVEWRNLSRI